MYGLHAIATDQGITIYNLCATGVPTYMDTKYGVNTTKFKTRAPGELTRAPNPLIGVPLHQLAHHQNAI